MDKRVLHLTNEGDYMKMPDNSVVTPNVDIDEEIYFAAHPLASGQQTMRVAFSTQESRKLEIQVHSDHPITTDETDRSTDEAYFTKHPLATGLQTMRFFGSTVQVAERAIVPYAPTDSTLRF